MDEANSAISANSPINPNTEPRSSSLSATENHEAVGTEQPPENKKRGRPRKAARVVDLKKPVSRRGKTGCKSCRMVKKKCDEEKPTCRACRQNSRECHYDPKREYIRGSSKAVVPPTGDEYLATQFPSALALHFLLSEDPDDRESSYLSFLDPNVAHPGLRHSVLSLSATLLSSDERKLDPSWVERQVHHTHQALVLLREDLGRAGTDHARETSLAVDNHLGLRSFVLFLQTLHSGGSHGDYHMSLNLTKHLVVDPPIPVNKATTLDRSLRESILFYSCCSMFTSERDPFDTQFQQLWTSLQLSPTMSRTDGNHFGVFDGLFEILPRLRTLRDNRRRGVQALRCPDLLALHSSVYVSEAQALCTALNAWKSPYNPQDLRYSAACLYRTCMWIYLNRTMMLTADVPEMIKMVDQALKLVHKCLRAEMLSILLLPLFLVGCAASEGAHRNRVEEAFGELSSQRTGENVVRAQEVVREVWARMQRDDVVGAWDWEGILKERGLDFIAL